MVLSYKAAWSHSSSYLRDQLITHLMKYFCPRVSSKSSSSLLLWLLNVCVWPKFMPDHISGHFPSNISIFRGFDRYKSRYVYVRAYSPFYWSLYLHDQTEPPQMKTSSRRHQRMYIYSWPYSPFHPPSHLQKTSQYQAFFTSSRWSVHRQRPRWTPA